MDMWERVKESWRRHAHFLFDKYCEYYAVLREMRFAGEQKPGRPLRRDSDALLVGVSDDGVSECVVCDECVSE